MIPQLKDGIRRLFLGFHPPPCLRASVVKFPPRLRAFRVDFTPEARLRPPSLA